MTGLEIDRIFALLTRVESIWSAWTFIDVEKSAFYLNGLATLTWY